MPKAKPYKGPVDDIIAHQLLNSTGQTVLVDGETLSLGNALQAVKKRLYGLVEMANEVLENNEFADMVAENLAVLANKRGVAKVEVGDDGSMELFVNYRGTPRKRAERKRKRKIPLMNELKERASQLGVEIPEEFGIKRSAILGYLNDVEDGTVSKPTKRKKKKVRPKLQIADDPPDTDNGPMSAGPDEVKILAPLDEEKPPKKRGFVKTGDAVTPKVVVNDVVAVHVTPKGENGKRANPPKSQGEPAAPTARKSMRQMVEDSKEVDISNLLASDPPE